MFWHAANELLITGENKTCEAAGIIMLLDDVGTPPHQFAAVNQSVLEAPVQYPVVPQLIILVSDALIFVQPFVEKTVSVATKEPAGMEAAKVASAGSLF